jgi:hypothetical protein
LQALRMVAQHIYLTALHLRGLLGCFRGDSERKEAFVIYYMRVLDMHNEKVFRVRFENQDDLAVLRDRLGYVLMFPFIQPEQGILGSNSRRQTVLSSLFVNAPELRILDPGSWIKDPASSILNPRS